MKWKHIALVYGGALLLSACGGGNSDGNGGNGDNSGGAPPVQTHPDPTVDATSIDYNDVPVHDPSVFRDDDGTFYVVGSHLAMASSQDLVTWEQVAPGIDLENPDFSANPLFSNYDVEVSEGIEWTGGYAGSWASDIRKLADGRYYFYYNHCNSPESGVCDRPRSYLGVAASEGDILGPYEDLGIFLRSGQTQEEIEAGYGVGDMESYNGFIHPNTIDPHTFHDKDGNLWMIYGSYAGGIFILEMDETTGKPRPGQGYGKHLAGGDHSAIEGTFVLYSPESDYYYLFASFGGFVSTDGYNIRIARSHNPDGPYLDAEGNDMAQARGGWDSIEPFGVKLMGGFLFESEVGDPAGSRGYLAPGHNSAYYDPDTEKHFLITHTRFPNQGEQHAIRVHELFVNEDGWLVASPHRYAPIEGDNIVDVEDVVGDYHFINHGKGINRQANRSRAITLTEEGSITGEVTGTYELYGDNTNRITLRLDELGIFEGEMRWQWDERIEALVPVFTAVSETGVSVWGSRLPAMSNAGVLQSVADDLAVPDTFKGDAIDLPTQGMRGTEIHWETDNDQVIKTDGRVLRPNVGTGDEVVTLTATLSRQDSELSESFSILIPQREPFNRIARFDFENDLTETLGNFEAGAATGDRLWKTGEGNLSYAAGSDGQALALDGANGVLLPSGLISNYEYTVSFWVHPDVITAFTPAFFGAINEQTSDEGGDPFSEQWISFLPEGWDGNTMLWSGSQAWFDGSAGERIVEGEWSHMAFSVDRGLVKVYINGVEKFSAGNLTDFFSQNEGTFTLGVNYWDAPFDGLIDELNIYEAALSAGEVKALDVDKLPPSELLGIAHDELDLGDISAVQDDMPLPVTGPFASAIDWTSSDPSVIQINADTGVVSRPDASTGNVDVTLAATLTLDGDSVTREFVATVLSLGMPDPAAHYSFDEHLADDTGNFGQGMTSGDRLDNTGGSVAYAPGQIGSALDLDGTYGIKLPDNLLTDATYSLSLWLHPRTLTQFTTAFFGAASTESWISVVPFGPGAGNTMLWSGTAWYDGDTGTQIPTDSWSHFVAVNNGGNLTLYLDGEEVFTGTNFPDVFTPSETSEFGVGVNYWDAPFDGLVDELRLYNEPLSDDDVETLFNAAP